MLVASICVLPVAYFCGTSLHQYAYHLLRIFIATHGNVFRAISVVNIPCNVRSITPPCGGSLGQITIKCVVGIFLYLESNYNVPLFSKNKINLQFTFYLTFSFLTVLYRIISDSFDETVSDHCCDDWKTVNSRVFLFDFWFILWISSFCMFKLVWVSYRR